jgi:hypothetical protein
MAFIIPFPVTSERISDAITVDALYRHMSHPRQCYRPVSNPFHLRQRIHVGRAEASRRSYLRLHRFTSAASLRCRSGYHVHM